MFLLPFYCEGWHGYRRRPAWCWSAEVSTCCTTRVKKEKVVSLPTAQCLLSPNTQHPQRHLLSFYTNYFLAFLFTCTTYTCMPTTAELCLFCRNGIHSMCSLGSDFFHSALTLLSRIMELEAGLGTGWNAYVFEDQMTTPTNCNPLELEILG